MTYAVRFTRTARDDLRRLFEFLAEQDIAAARRAYRAIEKGFELLAEFPFTCRKANADSAFLRELVITFASRGYVALFEVENERTVTVLAVRHQREDDFF